MVTKTLRLPQRKACPYCARRERCKSYKHFRGSDDAHCIFYKKEKVRRKRAGMGFCKHVKKTVKSEQID